tara:strand:- start:2251 stop:2532 length:282 start_codon:yes stop_codon:yes gene_type:complete
VDIILYPKKHKEVNKVRKIMNQVWSEAEKQFIRDSAGKLTDEAGAIELSKVCGRIVTVNAWRKQRQKMGIKKNPGRGVCSVRQESETECDSSS